MVNCGRHGVHLAIAIGNCERSSLHLRPKMNFIPRQCTWEFSHLHVLQSTCHSHQFCFCYIYLCLHCTFPFPELHLQFLLTFRYRHQIISVQHLHFPYQAASDLTDHIHNPNKRQWAQCSSLISSNHIIKPTTQSVIHSYSCSCSFIHAHYHIN